MPTKTVTAEYINPPRPGKDWWSIKDEKGQSYWKKAPINDIASGALLSLTYDVGKDGFHKIVKYEPITNGTGGTPQYRAETPSRDAERIWCQGILQQYIASGQIPLDTASIVAAASKIMTAYRQINAPQVQSGRDFGPKDELEDEIPY